MERWYFYFSRSKLRISNMKRSCNLSVWEPPGAVRHDYCSLADGLREKCHPPYMHISPTYHSYCPTLLLLVQPKPVPVSTQGGHEQATVPKLTPLRSFQLQHGSNIANMVLLCQEIQDPMGFSFLPPWQRLSRARKTEEKKEFQMHLALFNLLF